MATPPAGGRSGAAAGSRVAMSRSGAAVALVMLLTLPACTRGAAPAEELSRRVVADAPAGYEPAPAAAGALPADAAAAATVVPADKLAPVLRRGGYRGGYSRVWTRGSDYISVLLYEFDHPRGPQDLIELELREIKDSLGGSIFQVRTVPNAHGFLLPSQRPGQRSSEFCQGIWLRKARTAVQLLQCTQAPDNMLRLEELVRRQEKLVT